MRALALRLEGPLQSWGGPVAGDDRPSFDVPTKSGVIGLVGGALGIGRHETERLVALHEALALVVRVDRPGVRGVDFHTAMDVPTAEGKLRRHPVVSRRTYLYDASFAALLVEVRPTSLEAMLAALRRPVYAPYLGRRACVPSVPVLASQNVLEGNDWFELLDQVPLSAREGEDPHAPRDVFVEAALVSEREEHRVRRVRDTLVGPLPRLFGERLVYGTRRTFTPPPEPSAVFADESIDRWF